MRLFPRDLEITETEGFMPDKDIFGLKDIGDRLSRIVANLEGPAVLLLDAPWGSGKTIFIKMWRGELLKRGIPSIYFDAFANDYLDDGFLAVAGEIIARAEKLKPAQRKLLRTFKDKAIQTGKVLGRSTARLALRIGTGGLLSGTEIEEGIKVTGEIAKSIGDEAAAAADEILKEALESHAKDREVFGDFRNALSTLASGIANSESPDEGKLTSKLVFIIDELDRCRPTFALDLLEKIKHFYNVPNVIFLLSSSSNQLEQAIKYRYGNIDSRSYLEKFFQLRILLPTGTLDRPSMMVEKYVGHLLTQLPQGEDPNRIPYIGQFLGAFSGYHPLSLRTLERIITYVVLALVCSPQNHLFPSPIVSGLATMKVLDPPLYEATRSGNITFDQAERFFRFGEWKEKHDPNRQARIGEYSARFWRYALGALPPNDNFGESLVQFNFNSPRTIITWASGIIDGFSIPDNI